VAPRSTRCARSGQALWARNSRWISAPDFRPGLKYVALRSLLPRIGATLAFPLPIIPLTSLLD
jgi:hypothetical protein